MPYFAAASCALAAAFTPAGDWPAGDADGDGVEDQLQIHVEADYRVEVSLIASGGAQHMLLRTEPFEHPLLVMCGVIEDLTDDDRAEVVLTTRAHAADGSSLYRARLYCGATWEFLGQLCFGFDPNGNPILPVLQKPGDVDGDGIVGLSDVVQVAAEAARQHPTPIELSRTQVLAADSQGDGSIEMSDLSRVVESAIVDSTVLPPHALLRFQQLLLQPSADWPIVGGVLRFLGRLIGVIDCVACAEDCGESFEVAKRFIDEFNASFDYCRDCMSTGHCPIEDEVECWRRYKEAIVKLAELAKAAGDECAKCIHKCAGKFRTE